MTPMHVGVAGEYTLVRRNADTGEVVESLGPFKNLITNAGLDRMAVGNTHPYCFVGSGNTPPAVGNTSMQALVASSSAQQAASSSTLSTSPYTASKSVTFRFQRGAAAGNLAEVGVGWSSTGNGALFSRALIVDSGGNPVVITVLANEVLDVTYTLRHYPVLTDSTASVVISGTTYSLAIRSAGLPGRLNRDRSMAPLLMRAYRDFSMGTVNSEPGGTVITSPSRTSLATYTPGSYYLDATFVLDENSGNHPSGISGLSIYSEGELDGASLVYAQMSVSPPMMKDNTKTLTLTFRISWGRYTP